MSDKKNKETKKKLKFFYFTQENVSIKAESLEEAQKKLKELKNIKK